MMASRRPFDGATVARERRMNASPRALAARIERRVQFGLTSTVGWSCVALGAHGDLEDLHLRARDDPRARDPETP